MDRFTELYRSGGWKSGFAETRCGAGSTLEYTERLRRALPPLLARYNIRSIVDAGCGDRNWISHLDLPDYTGVDIVPELADICMDISTEKLPRADLVICRFVFNHLPTRKIQAALANMDAQYLLAGTHANAVNEDIEEGEYRDVNLRIEPFNMEPLEEIRDYAERHSPHCMALFSL